MGEESQNETNYRRLPLHLILRKINFELFSNDLKVAKYGQGEGE